MVNEPFYFEAPQEYDTNTVKKKWKDNTPEIITKLRHVLEATLPFNEAEIDKEFKAFLESEGLGFGAVMPGFRLLVTGKGMGPSMSAICSLLGKEEVLKRIDNGLKSLGNA